jgi:hypothetical protein
MATAPGRVLRPSSVVAFVARHRRLAALRGLDVARPRVAFHWTQASQRVLRKIGKTEKMMEHFFLIVLREHVLGDFFG